MDQVKTGCEKNLASNLLATIVQPHQQLIDSLWSLILLLEVLVWLWIYVGVKVFPAVFRDILWRVRPALHYSFQDFTEASLIQLNHMTIRCSVVCDLMIVNILLRFCVRFYGTHTLFRLRVHHHPIYARRIKGIHHRSRPPIVITLVPRQLRLFRVHELPSRHPACCSLSAYLLPSHSVKMTSDNVFRSC